MGSLIKTVFGGSTSKQASQSTQEAENESTSVGQNESNSTSSSTSYNDSGNQAYGYLKDAMSGEVGQGDTASKMIAALLGGDASGLNSYLGATGFGQVLNKGLSGITGAGAANGLLRSGGTGKALTQYGNDLSQQYAGNYLDNLFKQVSAGQGAGNLISGAGNYSKGGSTSNSTSNSFGSSFGLSKGTSTGQSTGSGSSSSYNGNLGSFIGGIAASDIRLKKNIKKIKTLDNGLGLYKYDYINGKGPYVGVMAHEVKAIMPEALGPVIDGLMTVDYDKIGGLNG